MNSYRNFLLEDLKGERYEIKDTNIKYPNFYRLLLFYSDQNKSHLELCCEGFINNLFEWWAQNFDVINSFWSVFKCALLINNEKLGVWETNEYKNKYPMLKYKNKCLTSKTFSENLINDKFDKEYIDEIYKCLDTFPMLDEFASLTHSFANFMPCPDNLFNICKGVSETADNLSMFVKRIINSEELIYKNNDYIRIIDQNTKDEWYKWFVDIQEKAFLEDYYEIKDNILISKEMFANQNIQTYPHNKNELDEYLNNIINFIYNRGNRMTAYFQNLDFIDSKKYLEKDWKYVDEFFNKNNETLQEIFNELFDEVLLDDGNINN